MKLPSQDLLDEGPSAAEVLQDLRTATADPERLRQAVLNAEVLEFSPAEASDLIRLLQGYVERHRHSTEPIDITVVCSAIRKLIAAAPVQELPSLAAELLNRRAKPSLQIQIVVAKMITRKLVASEGSCPVPYDRLRHCLWDLVRESLNRDTIEQRGHGAIALDACLSLGMLGPPGLEELLDRVKALDAPWFQKLLSREALNLAAEMRRRYRASPCKRTAECLEALANAAAPSGEK